MYNIRYIQKFAPIIYVIYDSTYHIHHIRKYLPYTSYTQYLPYTLYTTVPTIYVIYEAPTIYVIYVVPTIYNIYESIALPYTKVYPYRIRKYPSPPYTTSPPTHIRNPPPDLYTKSGHGSADLLKKFFSKFSNSPKKAILSSKESNAIFQRKQSYLQKKLKCFQRN
jgi:hypothetical protein